MVSRLLNKLKYIKSHDLRHTSATLLINQGVHAKIISERLGHANITTTMNIYGHVLSKADKQINSIRSFHSKIAKKHKNPNDICINRSGSYFKDYNVHSKSALF
ncbi:tyrosine-type recombinase/integrase [Paenibacillus sp. GCM10027629]|uniref:tyrosine-type recombinase/integrase n=1 Tax=Paenibacillus sp. GCM10027629 TaxID=3273414 RepID=UPI00363EDC0E